MGLNFPDDEKKQTFDFTPEKEEKPQPELYPIDCTKAETIQELGIIFNALGVGITEEFAKLHQLEHLVIWPEEK